MNCKNCQKLLEQDAHFCDNCGAKVVDNRITFKQLFSDFFINVFGFDSTFFNTLKKMVLQPDVVINDYLSGVRKRYMNPFAFLAIGAGLSLLIFNYFADDFIAIQSNLQSEQITDLKEKASLDISKLKNLSEKEKQQKEIEKKISQMQLDFNGGMWDFMLRYFNLLTFVFLFLYAVLSKWTFWKPHNFGEHIVMNGFIYGFTTYLTIVFFFLAILIHPTIYIISVFVMILFYMYAFGKIYKLSVGKSILKFLRFLLGLIIIFIVFVIASIIIGMAMAYFGFMKV